jgi:hypothetical protein
VAAPHAKDWDAKCLCLTLLPNFASPIVCVANGFWSHLGHLLAGPCARTPCIAFIHNTNPSIVLGRPRGRELEQLTVCELQCFTRNRKLVFGRNGRATGLMHRMQVDSSPDLSTRKAGHHLPFIKLEIGEY